MLTIYKQRKKEPSRDLFAVLRFPEFPAQALWAKYLSQKGFSFSAKKPFVVVEQEEDSHKTRVLAVSPLARAMGVEAGMPLQAARRKSALIVPELRDKESETKLEENLGYICQWYTPSFEVGYQGTVVLDLSGTPLSRNSGMEEIGRLLQSDMKQHINMFDVAVGISRSKLVAEVLARLALPNRLNICPFGEEESTLASLPSSLLPRLSPKCREKLRLFGFKTVGQLQKVSRQSILSHFGPEGDKLYAMCRGFSQGDVIKEKAGDAKPNVLHSFVSVEKDSNDMKMLMEKLREAVDQLCFSLKKQNSLTRSCRLELIYGDGKKARRSLKLAVATSDFLTLYHKACGAFVEMYTRRVSLKKISLFASRLGENEGQLNFFQSDWEHKQQKLGDALTNIRLKNKFSVIGNADMVITKNSGAMLNGFYSRPN